MGITKIKIRAAFGIGFLASIVFLLAQAGQVRADPFTCSGSFYQIVGQQLKELDAETGTYTNIDGPFAETLNAVGYNIEDDYLYALGTSGELLGDLIRIEGDGSITNLGNPTGLPIEAYVAGDFDEAGNLYVHEFGSTSEIWVIDVSEGTATVLNTSSSLSISELVHVDGYLYALYSPTLYQLDIATGNVNSYAVSGLESISGTFGAGWSTDEGELYFSHNSTGGIYRIDDYDTASPSATLVFDGAEIFSNNDGASCPNAASMITDIEAVDDTYTTNNTSVLSVTTTNGLLDNDTGNGLTIIDYTQPTHGSVSVGGDGSLDYTPTTGYTGVDSFTYTIENVFGTTSTASVTINITEPAAADSSGDTDGLLADTGSAQLVGLFSAGGLLVLGLALLKWRNIFG